MELTVGERLILLQIIPPQTGSLSKLKIARQLRNSLGFDEAEHAEFEIKEEPGRIQWNREKDAAKEIEIGEVAKGIIADAIKDGDEKGGLREEWLPLLGRFQPDEEEQCSIPVGSE